MFDNTILVVSMWIVTCKGMGAVPGHTQKHLTLPGLGLVQVSLQECIQVYFPILPFLCSSRATSWNILYSKKWFYVELTADSKYG